MWFDADILPLAIGIEFKAILHTIASSWWVSPHSGVVMEELSDPLCGARLVLHLVVDLPVFPCLLYPQDSLGHLSFPCFWGSCTLIHANHCEYHPPLSINRCILPNSRDLYTMSPPFVVLHKWRNIIHIFEHQIYHLHQR